MRLPPATASYRRLVRFGTYVSGKLLANGHNGLAENVQEATSLVLTQGRALEDHDYGAAVLIAQRDDRDDRLDVMARETRLALASRGLDAKKTTPYTAIFPEGVGHYTAAPLSKQRARYEQLAMRLEASLTEDDALHPNAARVREVLDGWIAASDALREHRNKRALLSTDMAQANESWRRVMDNTYGALIIESSRQGAELFFPSRRDRNTTADNLGDDGLAEV